MTTALLLIDLQKDYFPGGLFPLPNIETAQTHCETLLKAARQTRMPVVHIQHIFPKDAGPFLCENTDGIDIHERVSPLPDETLITKRAPNAFHDTHLHSHLQRHQCDHIVLTGAMTQMCVAATARAALDLGYHVTLCDDAVAAQAVQWGTTHLDDCQVNAVIFSALAMARVDIISSSILIKKWSLL